MTLRTLGTNATALNTAIAAYIQANLPPAAGSQWTDPNTVSYGGSW